MERLTKKNICGVPVFKDEYECDRCGEAIQRLPDVGNGSPTTRLYQYEEMQEKIEQRIAELKASSNYPHNFKGQMVEDFEWVLSLLD